MGKEYGDGVEHLQMCQQTATAGKEGRDQHSLMAVLLARGAQDLYKTLRSPLEKEWDAFGFGLIAADIE
ncbi:hypothetical protein EYF80_023722 [Liparis tanakae]|uniref:Uncharacterized protein n=1 Tax=Liparis tanakae TaxID=230148 RepID=A0A4Z2HMB8_9TELE|nr:hypothetical protein EYF80_023722 [Liparis tanakae]